MKYIFVHGLGQNVSSWSKTIAMLDESMDIHCPELSLMMENKEVTYDNLYEAFSEYCNSLSEPINLCGLSLGAILALNYTIDNPSKVKSLILIGGQYKMPKLILSLQNMVFKCLPNKIFVKMGLNKNQIIKLTKSMLDLDFSTQIADVVCPTMIIYGEKDRANKKAAQELANTILQAQLEIIEGAGHEVNTYAPTQLGHVIKYFIKNKN
ncbi:MAG: alpha/beta fold hydrolase [Cellulosilyticaceae bacterium]